MAEKPRISFNISLSLPEVAYGALYTNGRLSRRLSREVCSGATGPGRRGCDMETSLACIHFNPITRYRAKTSRRNATFVHLLWFTNLQATCKVQYFNQHDVYTRGFDNQL